MSYSDDSMRSLSESLKKTDGLKYAIKELNNNTNLLKLLIIEMAKANELKEIEQAKDLKELNEANVKYLGKKGEIILIKKEDNLFLFG